MIEIRDLHKYFGKLHVLKGIDLEVEKGEVLSVIGASGSGKSTLLYCINGLEPIQKGSGSSWTVPTFMTRAQTSTNCAQKLGMVFQQWNSFPASNCAWRMSPWRQRSPESVNLVRKAEAREVAATTTQAHVWLWKTS